MQRKKAKQHIGFWGRLGELLFYARSRLLQTLRFRKKLCFILSVALFISIVLIFAAGCFDCLRQLEWNWLLKLQVRSSWLCNLLANKANWLAGWMASIFCIPKGEVLFISISADQVVFSAEASSLSVAPAQVILNALGTGGITLSAISEFRARRFLGVSMRDVLRRYYPWHVCFMIMHILLYLIGIYSLEQELVRCGMLALVGVFLCSVYAFIFSLGVFSAEGLTRFYIGGITKQTRKNPVALRPSLISDIAFHIGKEYSEKSRKLTDWFKSYCIMFVSLLDLSQGRQGSKKSAPSLFNHDSWDESTIFTRCFFQKRELKCSNPSYYVIYNLTCDAPTDKASTLTFKDKINVAQLAWKNLFRPFADDTQGKAEVAAAVLTASYIYSYSQFMVMVCGLSLYQHNVDPIQTTGPIRTSFLWQVLKQSQLLQQDLCKTDTWLKKTCWIPYPFSCSPSEWEPYRKVLGLTELSVTLWAYTLHGMDPLKERMYTYNALLEIADYSDYYNIMTLRQEVRLYMAYGYMTYLNAMPLSQLRPSRAALSKLLRNFENTFCQKIRKID